MVKFFVLKSKDPKKKFTAVFQESYPSRGHLVEKKVDFGDSRYEDYTIHKDMKRRSNYISRHKKNEDWTNPFTPGALSRYILWEHPDINQAIRMFRDRFGFTGM